MEHCNGRSAYSPRVAECGDKMTHPAHRITRPVILSPFVRRALARELPAKEYAR